MTKHAAMRFVAVDWGTSNRRAYLIEDGRLLESREDDLGILKVPVGGFPQATAALVAPFSGLPVLMAGMIGSNRGWAEAAYCPAPASLDDLTAGVRWIEPGRIGIVPGVSYRDGSRADVMRGEEVQLLGSAAMGVLSPDSVACHPGTHNKWVVLEAGRIARFRTVITGELFGMLKRHSILAELMESDADADSPPFAAGVAHSLVHDDLLAELFAVRARVLLGAAQRSDSASYLSGLLCGADIRTGLADMEGTGLVHVVGRPSLTALTAAGLRLSGRHAAEVDGEQAFVAGMTAIAERIL